MPRSSLRLLAALLLLPLAACQTKGNKWNNPRDEAAFHPANLTAGGTRPPPTGSASGADAEPSGAPLDAMLGQVNGKPLYADPILNPMAAELARLGKDLELRPFAEEAKKLIGGALLSAVRDAQMLAKAESSLKDGQRAGLNGIVERHREEILRQYGQGSQALAEVNLFKDKGVGIKEEIRRFREEQLVGYYMFEKVTPLINVTRRDIERYYNDHQADYNKAEIRMLRLIRVPSPLESLRVVSALNGGKAFEVVAADTALNAFNAAKGGEYGTVQGAAQLRWPELNAAIETLKFKGAWAGPILTKENHTWFVGLADFQPSSGRTLDETQLEIRNILSNAQRKKLSDQIYAKAAQEGSCSDMGQMAETLMRVAIARYAVKAGR